MLGPGPIRLDKRPHQRLEIAGGRGMDSKQDDTRLRESNTALDGNLPEVFIQRQQDARRRFGEVQQGGVLPAGAIGSSPQHVVAGGSQQFDNRPRKVLVGEEAHLSGNRIGLVFVGQVTGVGQAGENVVSRQPGIVRQELVFGLTGGEEFENELDGQTRPANHWFAGQDLRIDDDAFRKRHNHSLVCNGAV